MLRGELSMRGWQHRVIAAATLVGGLLVGLAMGTPQAWAQWTTNGTIISYTNGSVGIGTTNPGKILELRGGDAEISAVETSANGQLTFGIGNWFDGVTVVGVFRTITYHPFVVATNNAERVRITETGNVGIGTKQPVAMLHVAGNAQVDGNIAAKYQDVAEWVKAVGELSQGTVVVIDPHESNRVAAASEAYDTRVAGVVSTKPGVLLGESGEGKAKVAHSGRVKVKVDASYGPIAVGDLLVTSPTPGYAMRSEPVNIGGIAMHRPGTLIGKALEPLKVGHGEILMLLTLQ